VAALIEKLTPNVPLRIRIKGLPRPGAFEEFDLRRFRIGDTYDVTPQLATLLVVAGYAEIVAAPPLRAEAADRVETQRAKRKRQK
jgi:hypothetical protein